jgi:glycosyltransferase involved in cell wall biosynthesis
MRIHYLLREIARSNEVTLLSFAREHPSDTDIAAVKAYCQEVAIVPFRPYDPRRWDALLGFFLPEPRFVHATYSTEMERLVQEWMSRDEFDVVVAFAIGPSGGTAPYVRGVQGVPRLLEDPELSIIKDRISLQSRWYQRTRLRLTWWKLRRYMAGLLRDMNACTVSSAKERDLLTSIQPDGLPVQVIPNGVDPTLYDDDFGPLEPDTLVFPGAMTYRANFAAMAFFLREVFPLILRQRPGAKLYITGKTDGVPVHRLPLREGVVLTGYLQDVRPRIARSQVCVVPMTMGGGTRLKILEAMALGTPVVSTSKGAEGLDVRSGEEILIADDPETFAAQVVRLLEDPALRERLAQNGRRLVRERYDWREIGRRFEAFLEQVVAEWNDVDIN